MSKDTNKKGDFEIVESLRRNFKLQKKKKIQGVIVGLFNVITEPMQELRDEWALESANEALADKKRPITQTQHDQRVYKVEERKLFRKLASQEITRAEYDQACMELAVQYNVVGKTK